MNKLYFGLKKIIKESFIDRLYLFSRNISFKISTTNNIFFKLDHLRYPTKEFFGGAKYRDVERILKISQERFVNNINVITNFEKNFTLEKKIILEIGPGDNFLLDHIYLLNGAKKVYLVDRFKTTINNSFNLFLFKQYIKKLNKRNSIFNRNSLNMFIHNIIYFPNSPIESFNKLNRNSIDLIFSKDVLEHIYDLDLAIKTISLLLKKGGYTLHQVDLRDHLNVNEKYYLDFLKYSHRFWKYFGDITNRKRYPDYINLFEKYKLKIVNVKYIKAGPLSKINKIKKDFYHDYRNLNNEDLSIIRFEILAQKL